jgi:hypothetical protein
MFDTQLFVEVQLRGTQAPGATIFRGEADSALEGEIRLQSDAEIARGWCLISAGKRRGDPSIPN